MPPNFIRLVIPQVPPPQPPLQPPPQPPLQPPPQPAVAIGTAIGKKRKANGVRAVMKAVFATGSIAAGRKEWARHSAKIATKAFMLHVMSGNVEKVNAFMKRPNFDPNAPDKAGWTPLSNALNQGHIEVVKALLANDKVDPNAAGKNGFTPLQFAALIGHLEAVKALLTNEKVDPNAAHKDCGTPLQFAAGKGHLALVKALLTNDKVEPNAATKDGITPLHFAATNGGHDVVKIMLANEKVDPNAALSLLTQDATSHDLVNHTQQTFPRLGLESLHTMEGKKIKLLEHWANFRPDNPAQAGINKLWIAKTNFYLAQLQAKAEETAPLTEGTCGTGAVFRYRLALEQIIQATYGQQFIPEYAKALLHAAPDEAVFLINGVDLPKLEIQDLADGTGNYAQTIAMQQTIDNITQGGWEPNVHLGGFLLLGQDLLTEIQLRNKAVSKSGVSHPIQPLSETTLANLQSLKLSDAIKTTLCPEYKTVFDQASFKPEIAQYLNDPNNESLDPLAQKLLEKIQTLPLEERRSLNPNTSEERLQERLSIDEVRRVLVNIKTEMQLDPVITAWIETEAPKIDQTTLESQIRAHLASPENQSETVTGLAKKGLHNIWVQSEPINEQGLKTDTHSAIDALWRYIEHRPDAEVKQNLHDMLMSRLIDLGQNPVCNTGCVQRILMDASTIDTSLEAKEPDDAVILGEIQKRALEIDSDFNEKFMNTEETDALTDAEQYKSGKNSKSEVVSLKQDLLREDVMQDLIRRRGWSKEKVLQSLATVSDQIKDL